MSGEFNSTMNGIEMFEASFKTALEFCREIGESVDISKLFHKIF